MKDHIVVPLSGYTSTSRYKAEVRVISPNNARSTLAQQGSCFVGISLDSPNFLGSKLQAIVDYTSRHFENCIFLLGDHVHRLTLQIRKNLDREQCYYHALGLGDYYLRTQTQILRHKETRSAFPIIRGSDIHQQQEVKEYLMALKTVYENNLDFRAAIEGFAEKFIARSDENTDAQINKPEIISYSCQYVLEELAETCYMISLGHRVLVYPGSLAIFQQIADDIFLDIGLPTELDQLINVGLRLKRRGKKPAIVSQPLPVLSQGNVSA